MLLLLFTATFCVVQITEQVSLNKVLEVDKPYEFTNPLYPQSEPLEDNTHEWNLEVDGDSKIKLVCKDIRMMMRYDPSDDCPYVYFNIRDGNNNKKICPRSDGNFVYKSKGPKLQIKFVTSFDGSGMVKCTAIKLGEPKDQNLIHFKYAGEIYWFRIDSKTEIENEYFDRQWVFLGPIGTRISYQCVLSVNKMEPICGESVLTYNDGEHDEEICDYNNYVWISKTNRSSIRLQVPKAVRGFLSCTVQSITGPHVNEYENVQPVDGEDSSEHGLLTEDQTFNAHPLTNCECGWTNKARSRVYLGDEANPNEFPWMVNLIVTLRDNEYDSSDAICGGSIITPRHILSAAHCVEYNSAILPVEDVRIIIGKHHEDNPSEHEKTLGAAAIFVGNRYFEKGLSYDDIAVIVTNETIEFNRFIGPICIEPEYNDIMYKYLTIMGWGLTGEKGFSRYLRKAKVLVVDNSYCGAMIGMYVQGPLTALLAVLCSMKGDSGGPLVILDPETNRYTQISLVSRSAPGSLYCGGMATSTLVSYYYKWIQSKIKATVSSVETCHKI